MTSIVEIPTAASAPAAHRAPEPQPVRTHQAIAIVCALLCFAPLGIAAVVYAGNARTRLALGDLEGARRESRRAVVLCCLSATVTFVCLLVVVVGASSYSELH